jgi:hypothetical protein
MLRKKIPRCFSVGKKHLNGEGKTMVIHTKNIFLILILISAATFSNEITLDIIEVQQHGQHILIDIEIENDSEDIIYFNENFAPFKFYYSTDVKKWTRSSYHGGTYSANVESSIPLYPESSMLLQAHLQVYTEEDIESIKFTGSYFRAIPGKMVKNRLTPLVVEIDW